MINTQNIWLAQGGLLPYKPMVTGQVFPPNEPCFLPYECASGRLPERNNIAVGTRVLLTKSLEKGHAPLIQITDGAIVYLGGTVITEQFSFTQRSPLELICNGYGWQKPEFTSTDENNAARSGVANYTTSGSFTVPLGVNEITVNAKAADGGGGGGAYAAAYPSTPYAQSGTRGGSGGQVLNATIAVTAGDVIPITIGAAGAGGAAYGFWASSGGNFSFLRNGSNGGNAGLTQFGTFITIEGGKRGTGGQGTLNSPPPAINHGAGGAVTVNTTNGVATDGAQGEGGAGGAAAQHIGGSASSYPGSAGAAGYVTVSWEVIA